MASPSGTLSSPIFANVAFGAAVLALVCLAALHVLSPAFDPAWRMVSEYALGAYGAVLAGMFVAWAVSSWALALALRPHVRGWLGGAGLVFLVLAGVGEAMAAVFDVRAPLHGVAAMIGIPSLPVAAMLLSFGLTQQDAWRPARASLLWSANATWVSFVLMGAAMAVFAPALASSPATPPVGVMLVNGWANRLLIVVYCAWVMIAARAAAHVGPAPK